MEHLQNHILDLNLIICNFGHQCMRVLFESYLRNVEICLTHLSPNNSNKSCPLVGAPNKYLGSLVSNMTEPYLFRPPLLQFLQLRSTWE